MDLKLKKVYTVSKKGNPERPRLFLQHLVCEAAGFKPQGEIYIKINDEKQEILIQNYPFNEETDIHIVHVSSRKSRLSDKERPLIDTAGERYSFLDINQKIEVNVFKSGEKGQIIVRPLEYNLFKNTTIPTPRDQRIRLLSICAGAGIATAALHDTGLYSPTQEIELKDDCVEVLLHNFPNSTIFAGDVRDVQNVSEVDMAFVSLPCVEHSSLGFLEGNVMHDLAIATSKIISSSRASVLFFENVDGFYKSASWETLKNLLSDEYPFWTQKSIEAWDFGSIATRPRTYACAFRDEERFLQFQFPTPPKVRRKKLKDYLDSSKVEHEWKSVSKWMESFNSREAWRNRSLQYTFVGKDAEKISCLPSRYTAQCASNSHVLSEDGQSWRFLSINEIKRILGVPEWFSFPEHTQKIRKYEMLGQSVDCRVIKAIANRIAYCFMKVKDVAANSIKKAQQSYNISNNGQLELLLS